VGHRLAAAAIILLAIGAVRSEAESSGTADVVEAAIPVLSYVSPTERHVLQSAAERIAAGQPQAALNALAGYLELSVTGETTAAARMVSARAYHLLSSPWRRDRALREVLDSDVSQEVRGQAAEELGTFLYNEGRHEEALALWERSMAAGIRLSLLHRLKLLWLQAAGHRKPELVRRRFMAMDPSAFTTEEERRIYGLIARRIFVHHVTPESLGLLDGNVSAIAPDYDDLWIGTWTGGVARYSFSAGTADVFQTGRKTLVPTTIRSIEVGPGTVWVGAYDGLFVYDKRTSRWREVFRPNGRSLEKVQSVLAVGDTVYAATAGQGIWEYRQGSLRRHATDSGIGLLVNCLYRLDDAVLVGTLDRGAFLVRLDASGGAVVETLTDTVPGLDAVNVTCFVRDGATIWVGTYGEGLYEWDRRTGRVSHFRKQDGPIPDDWILGGVATDRAAYFGTFGGGVAVFDKTTNTWRNFGIAQGLASADVASVAFWKSQLYFGTLGGGVTVFDERGYETIP
jgi:hypothetical protein